MVDPDWPTRPWHLALESREKWTAGYLVEHTHRIRGFLVGGLVSVLALGIWAYEPRKALRWTALIALVALLAGFGYFHREMMAQINAPTVHVPLVATLATLIPLLGIFGVCICVLRRAVPGAGVRVLSMAALVAVMIQGLLGGLRVRLNELVGADLAIIHGVFATVVLSMLVSIAVLTSRGPAEPLPFADRRKLGILTWSLVAFTLVQIVFGALVRHIPNASGARLHLLFAFVVVGFVILVIKQAYADPASRRRLKWPARALMFLIAIQIMLGVEAWMGKFMTAVSVEAQKAPSLGQAILRTAHAHVGAWILAVGVVFALVVRRQPAERIGPASTSSLNWQDAIPRQAAMSVRSPS